MAESKYSIFLNNEQLKRDAKRASDMLKDIGDSAVAEGARIDSAFKKAASAIGVSLAGISVGSFVQKMFKIRSEFQDTESSMTVFLGSAEKAAKFMKELQDYAWYNMFEFSDLTKESAKLLAYGNDVKDVIGILDKLSNVAAGTKQPLGDLIDLYNKAKNVGKIDAMGFQQWAARGLVLTDVLKGVGIEADRSNISFEQLKIALDAVTSSGGMFHDLMGRQLNNLSASVGQLQDSITIMFNELGQKSEGVMKSAIDSANYLVENYEKIGKIIIELVATYGVYRGALVAVSVAQNVNTALLAANTTAQRLNAISGTNLNAITLLLTKSWKSLNATMLANPAVLIGAAVAGLAFVIYKLITYQDEAAKAQKRLNEATKEFNQLTISEQAEIDRLFAKLRNTSKESANYQKVKDEIISKYGSYLSGLKDEVKGLHDVAAAHRAVSAAARQSAIDRAIAAAEKTELDVYSKNVVNTNEKLLKSIKDSGKMSEGAAEAFFETIQLELEKTGKLSDETVAKLKQFEKIEVTSDFNAKSTTSRVVNNVDTQIKKLQQHKEQLDNSYKQIAQSFGVSTNEYEGLAKEQVNTYISVFEKAISQFKNSGKSQKLKVFDKDVIFESEEELRLHLAKLKGIRDSVDTGTGSNQEQTTKNKSYWEEKKKEAEEARNALDVSKKNSDEWNEYTRQIAEAQREIEKYAGTSKKSEDKSKDFTEQLKREAQEQIRIYEDLEFSVAQARINAMDEGANKTLAQNKFNYDREKKQLERQQEDMLHQLIEFEKTKYLAKNQAKTEDDWNKSEEKKSVALSESELKNLTALEKEALKAFEAESKRVWSNLAMEYGGYLEKRTALTTKWEKIIAGTPEQFQAGAKQKREEEISKLDEEYGKVSKTLETLFDGAADKSVAEMRKIITEAETMYEALESGSYDMSFGITEEQFNTLRRSPEEMKKIAKAIAEMRKEADNSENAFKKVSDGLNKIFNAGNDKDKLKAGLNMLKDGLAEINDLAQSVGDNISKLFASFGNDEAAGMAENITNLIGGVGQAGMGIAKLYSGDIIGGIKDTVAGVTNVITSIVKIGDSAKEKKIQALQQAYDALDSQISIIDRKVSKLQKEQAKAFSTDKSDLILKENEELQKEIENRNKQIKILQEQIAKERDKKDTDYGRIDSWNKEIEAERQAIEDLRERIQDNKEATIDAIIGKDIQSAINDFAQAYVDAWAAGEDKATAMKDVVRKMIKSAITELIKSRLSPEVNAFMEFLATAMEDGILTVAEQNTLDALEAAINNKLANLDSSLDKYMKDTDAARQASQKGFASMSQDSADELNGRFTAIQAHTYSITENTKILVANSGRILQHLAGIESNTEFCRRLNGMDADLKAMRLDIADMNLKGLKIRTS